MQEPTPNELIHVAAMAALWAKHEEHAPDGEDVTPWEKQAIATVKAWAEGLEHMSDAEEASLAIDLLVGQGFDVKASLWGDSFEKMLTVKTSHITVEIAEQMNVGNFFGLMAYDKSDHGWFIHVDELIEEEVFNGLPKELAALYEHAAACGCYWLCLDQDGDELPTFPTYEW